MANRPNVILATPTWSLNGPNVFSANLVRGLRSRDIPANIVLTRPDWRDSKPFAQPRDIPFETLPVNRFMSFRARCAAMTQYLEQRSPCVYIPNHDFGHSCISSQLSQSVAIVGIVHSDDPQHYEHVTRLGGYWNAVVGVSSFIAKETSRIAPSLAPHIAVIPYGIEPAAEFPNRLLSPRHPSKDRPLRVIYAGRLDHSQKRVLDLPKIMQAVAEIDIPIHLTIAGGGPMEMQLRALFKTSGAGRSVDFLGTLESAELLRLFATQDVFLLTSGFEGLPMAVLEAMGQGCVPVVSDIRSGIPELIEDGVDGFRVQVGHIQGFANRLAQLRNDEPMRLKMAYAAYNKTKSGCYRMDRMVQSYARLFDAMLHPARGGYLRRADGRIRPPPNLPWPEYLPGPVQSWGHSVKQLLDTRKS